MAKATNKKNEPPKGEWKQTGIPEINIPTSMPYYEAKEPPEPDWKAIAMEIWNEYDDVALFWESHWSDINKEIPYLTKALPRRFKHFRFHKGQIVTIAEYEKDRKRENELMMNLFKS